MGYASSLLYHSYNWYTIVYWYTRTSPPGVKVDLIDNPGFDHASWADILEPHTLADAPAEVRTYMDKPKCFLNFEEFDYGDMSTKYFKQARPAPPQSL